MATTNTEIYRRFQGGVQTRVPRFLVLARANVRTALRRKLALVLFVPPAIATVIFSFIVYSKFALEAGLGAGPIAGPGVSAVAAYAGQLIEVRGQIVQFNLAMSLFSLLVLAWYGAGLIAEDVRLGAHLLYFSRPLTRFDYLAGKFGVAAFFGALAVLAPGLVICTVASFASPQWSFLKNEGEVVLHTIAFALVWTAVMPSVVLAISALVRRKTFALAGIFGFFMVPQAIATLVAELQRDGSWLMLSPLGNLRRVAGAIFGVRTMLGRSLDWDPVWSWLVLSGLALVSWIVLFARARRMETAG
jgi:ABC-2 type transport system permease protein